MVLPPAIQALMQSQPAGTPEQQVHQAAAAAAAAAAVMSSPYSTYSTMMLPPSIIPLGEPPKFSAAVRECYGCKHNRDLTSQRVCSGLRMGTTVCFVEPAWCLG